VVVVVVVGGGGGGGIEIRSPSTQQGILMKHNLCHYQYFRSSGFEFPFRKLRSGRWNIIKK
jgi:hypothetical protein